MMPAAKPDARAGRSPLRPARVHKGQRVLCVGRRVECFCCAGSRLDPYGLCNECGGLGTRLVIERVVRS